MKKSLVTGIISLAAAVVSFAQGSIVLYNYNTGKLVTYGNGAGGTPGQPIVAASGFTIGFYWGVGDLTAQINTSDFIQDSTSNTFTGSWNPFGNPQLSLFTGANGTAHLGATDSPGYFSDVTSAANLGVAGGTTVTLVVIAYNGANYASSTMRGHSLAFTMTAKAAPQGFDYVGTFMPAGFTISLPEPSTFALAALGSAGVWCFRRRSKNA